MRPADRQIRVLVVHDSTVALRTVCQHLKRRRNVEIIAAAMTDDGGLDLVENLAPDLVLMDLQLPGMRGVEATQQLTRLFPNLPVIMFTIQQAAQLQRTCLETGACGFVSKERFNQEFPRLLNQVLRFSVMECAPNALPA